MSGSTGLAPGFNDPVMDSQSTFRIILEAMARPGRIFNLPVLPETPSPLYPSAGAICLSLLDLDTPVWLDDALFKKEIRQYLGFHCGCPFTPNGKEASFALAGDCRNIPALESFALGSMEYPETSTTLIIQVESLENKPGVRFSGPGIENEEYIAATGLPGGFWREVRANNSLFPRGVDIFLVGPGSVCGAPRTVQVEA